VPRILNDPTIRDYARKLRADATEAEKRLWRALRGEALGIRFRRQHPIGGDIADFACVELRIVIELDGGQHGGDADRARDTTMRAAGWRVLRYWNNDVVDNFDGMLADIMRVVAEEKAR
jgi:very-short-patch-repair endonuclease